MRIGTWNLDGGHSQQHVDLLVSADCDVWLLTEVHEALAVPGYAGHPCHAEMRRQVRWAAIFSRLPVEPLADPHPASAMGKIGDTTFVSSVLPWRSSGGSPHWKGDSQGERTTRAVDELRGSVPASGLVWGGDWNHELQGRIYAGSNAGRGVIQTALDELALQAPTRDLPAAGGGLSIDHIAIGSRLDAHSEHIVAAEAGRRLSDHDVYVVEVDLPRH